MGIDGANIAKKSEKNISISRPKKDIKEAPKEKSLPLAIGLNFVLPGAGYVYLGRPILGILVILVVGLILFTAGIFLLFQTWIGLNVIMAVDMLILQNKRNKAISNATTMACPQCAETIKQQAKICRFCGHKIAA